MPRKSEVSPVVAPSLMTWSGFYIGLNSGYTFASKTKVDWKGQFPTDNVSVDGLSAGIRAGYDWQFGRYIIGLAADYSYFAVSGNQGEMVAPTLFNIATSIKSNATLRAKLGYAFSDKWAGYVTGGYALGRVNADETFLGAHSGAITKTATGYTLGLGGEYKITRNWAAFGEYRYTGLSVNDTYYGNIKPKLNTLNLGVNYRF